MRWATSVCVLAVFAVLAALFLLRYQFVPVSDDGQKTAYVLDRWTGEVRMLIQGQYVVVKEYRPKP